MMANPRHIDLWTNANSVRIDMNWTPSLKSLVLYDGEQLDVEGRGKEFEYMRFEDCNDLTGISNVRCQESTVSTAGITQLHGLQRFLRETKCQTLTLMLAEGTTLDVDGPAVPVERLTLTMGESMFAKVLRRVALTTTCELAVTAELLTAPMFKTATFAALRWFVVYDLPSSHMLYRADMRFANFPDAMIRDVVGHMLAQGCRVALRLYGWSDYLLEVPADVYVDLIGPAFVPTQDGPRWTRKLS